jgi:hypothetical protein
MVKNHALLGHRSVLEMETTHFFVTAPRVASSTRAEPVPSVQPAATDRLLLAERAAPAAATAFSSRLMVATPLPRVEQLSPVVQPGVRDPGATRDFAPVAPLFPLAVAPHPRFF